MHHYKYAWDQNPTHVFTGSETTWNSGTLQLAPTAVGRWYLHLLSQNGENVSGTTADLGGYYVLNAPAIISQVPGSGGTSSTVTWTSVSGAYRYYAECDNNANFSSPELSSGWISGTNYTFNGLTSGTKYYYRVKANVMVAPSVFGESIWSSVFPRAVTWDGGGNDNFWQTPENWVGNIAPIAGDDLVFPAVANRKDSVNNYGSDVVFGSITVLGGGYQFQNQISASRPMLRLLRAH